MEVPEQTLPPLPPVIRKMLAEAMENGSLELPHLPGTAAEIMSLCNNEEVEARELAELVERDQSIASHVLKTANSVMYAPTEPIVSLQQAISRMGITALRDIAMSITLKGNVFDVPGYGVKVRNMWMHSAVTAMYSREVARKLRRSVEGAFLVGLLHDAGKPLVMQNLVRLAAKKTDKPIPPVIMEAAMNEFHANIGAKMVEAWNMPNWMVECVRYHHDYKKAEEQRDELLIVHLADELSHWALDPNRRDEDFPAEMPVIWDLNLYADDLADLLRMRGKVLEITEAFA